MFHLSLNVEKSKVFLYFVFEEWKPRTRQQSSTSPEENDVSLRRWMKCGPSVWRRQSFVSSRWLFSSRRLRVLRGQRQGEHQRAAGLWAPGGHHLREDVGARGRGGAGGSGHQDHQTDGQAHPATSEVLLIVGRVRPVAPRSREKDKNRLSIVTSLHTLFASVPVCDQLIIPMPTANPANSSLASSAPVPPPPVPGPVGLRVNCALDSVEF